MKLYTVYRDYDDTWKLETVEAQELPNSYRLPDRLQAFGYLMKLPKSDARVSLTEADAWDKAIGEASNYVSECEARVDAAKRQLADLLAARQGRGGG